MPAYIFLKVVETVITEKLTTNVGLEEIPHSSKRLSLIDKLSDYFMMSIGSVSNADTPWFVFFTADWGGAMSEEKYLKTSLKVAAFAVTAME